MKTRLRDPLLELEIISDQHISVMSLDFRDLMNAVATLHGTIPMLTYNIARVGVTDVWNVTANAVDGRIYSSTVSVVDNIPLYTLTSLPQGTAPEIAAFLALVQVFARYLATAEVSTVAINWG